MRIASKDNSPPNSFFNDALLMRIAANLPTDFLEEFNEIGHFVMTSKAQDLARLANSYVPRAVYHNSSIMSDPYVEIHPAYHALVRRAKLAGIASSIWEEQPKEKQLRYQLRAIRLFLTAGLENGHLAELVITSAAIGALTNDAALYQEWQNLILSRQHDASLIEPGQKKGVSFGLGFFDLDAIGPKTNLTAQKRGDSYYLDGYKSYVANANADAFLVTASLPEGLSCFFVPRFSQGRANFIKLDHMVSQLAYRSCPSAQLSFHGSEAWLIGEEAKGQNIIADIAMLLRFDEAVMTAGNLRSALQFTSRFLMERAPKTLSLTERVLADIALDIAGAQALVMRLAKAFDNALDNKYEAAYAHFLTPIAAFWIHNLAASIISELLSHLPRTAYETNGVLPRMLNDACKPSFRIGPSNDLTSDIMSAVARAPNLFKDLLAQQGQEMQAIGPKTVEVLYAALDIALNDPSSARLLIEQCAYSAALAALYSSDMAFIAECFAETRLGGQWRSSYGMLPIRRQPRQILELLYGYGF